MGSIRKTDLLPNKWKRSDAIISFGYRQEHMKLGFYK